MADRKVYVCRACTDELTPCFAVTDAREKPYCLHGVDDPAWTQLDPVTAYGVLVALAGEQAGKAQKEGS